MKYVCCVLISILSCEFLFYIKRHGLRCYIVVSEKVGPSGKVFVIFIYSLACDTCVKHCRFSSVFLPLASRSEIKTNGGKAYAYMRCFRCGRLVHHVVDCKSAGLWTCQCCFMSLLERKILYLDLPIR